jgi:hypothetical protein
MLLVTDDANLKVALFRIQNLLRPSRLGSANIPGAPSERDKGSKKKDALMINICTEFLLLTNIDLTLCKICTFLFLERETKCLLES